MSVRLAIAAGILAVGVCSSCLAVPSRIAARIAMLPTMFLQVTPAGNAEDESWIVWDQFEGNDKAVHLALCRRRGTCRWSHTWPDAYEPTIRLMGTWSTHSLGLFLVTYQQGAVAETAVVVGLSPGRAPVIYDQRDGVWVNVAPDNETVLINQDPGTRVDLDCFQWSASARRLTQVHCHQVLVGEKGYFP